MLEVLPGAGPAVELIRPIGWQLQLAFMPHGMCYLWEPGLVWLHAVSDSLIALGYYSIPALLVEFASQRRDVPFPWIFWLFGAFIIACGSTHLMEVWALWHLDCWVSGLLKAVTAGVSLWTAFELVPLMPGALALPSPALLEAVNRNLENQIQEPQKIESALRQSEARYRAIVAEALPEIEADPTQMRQLLQNLIDNALKFHRHGEAPAVKIRSNKLLKPEAQPAQTSSTTEVCQITVEDNSIGFDEKYLEKIFLPFERPHSRSDYSRTGIGLALCRKIAGRHGGSITAKSAPGKRATFTVTLPLKQAKGGKI